MNFFENIIDSMDYKTFLKIIYKIPSCIFFKDDQLRYVFCTKHWAQQNSDDIIGKTDLEIRKDKENAILAMEADKNILNTGKGCSYIIKSDIDGVVQYLELIKEPVFDDKGKAIGIVALINDVTEKTLFEQKLKELNSTDNLTRLYNRRAGVEIIETLLSEQCKDRAFILIDLNDFKHINDEYGHQMGDTVLKEFGLAIKRSLYDNDVALRLGGDEFIIFLADVKEREQVIGFLTKFQENIDNIKIKDFDETITAAIGVTLIKEPTTFDNLYSITDKMMYESKNMNIPYIIKEGILYYIDKGLVRWEI